MQTKAVAGFTLIEVLVAMLVLAVGVLGAARAQLAALHTRHDSSMRSAGVQLAAALAERMRANAGVMQGGDAGNPYLALDYDSARDGPPQPPAALCFGALACDSVQMAAFDVYESAQALHAGVPGGRLAVCRDAQAGRQLDWACSGAAGAPIVIKLGWRARGGGLPFAPAIALVALGALS